MKGYIYFIYSGSRLLHIANLKGDLIASLNKEYINNPKLKGLLNLNPISKIEYLNIDNDTDREIAFTYFSSKNKTVYNRVNEIIKVPSDLDIKKLDNMSKLTLDTRPLIGIVNTTKERSKIDELFAKSMKDINLIVEDKMAELSFQNPINRDEEITKIINYKKTSLSKAKKRYGIDLRKLERLERTLLQWKKTVLSVF